MRIIRENGTRSVKTGKDKGKETGRGLISDWKPFIVVVEVVSAFAISFVCL